MFFGDSYVNHHDHRALGWAVLDVAGAMAAGALYEPSAGPPHQLSTLLLAGTLEPDTWVDIGATIDAKLGALRCHESQVGEGVDVVADLVEARAAEAGRHAGSALRRRVPAALVRPPLTTGFARLDRLPLAHGAEREHGDHRHAESAQDGADHCAQRGVGRAIARALQIGDRIADHPAAQATDQDGGERQRPGADRRQRGVEPGVRGAGFGLGLGDVHESIFDALRVWGEIEAKLVPCGTGPWPEG